LHRFLGDEIELAYFEWRPDLAGREPTIFLVHATGFHARVWDQVISHLGERHIFSVDQRGHGRSEKAPIEHWRSMGQDLAGLIRHLELRDAVGVGHSMGGHAITEAAVVCPGAFQRLILVDPVIASPGDYRDGGWSIDVLEGAVHPVARRKDDFRSADEMYERFKDRPPYSLFEPAALRDYCDYGLLPAPDGDGYVLACPPATEASIYMTSRTNPGVYDAIRALEIPVTVLRAKRVEHRDGVMDFATSPTWPGLADEFPNGRDVYLPEQTHFLPMEASKLVAGYVLGTSG
jgi:pimeloyl-ACP methyl ester carboxylesterase